MRIRNILTRRCIPLQDFDRSVRFYEELVREEARLRFDYPAAGLRLAQVSSLLFIGGTEEALAPFRSTQATFLVDEIQEYARDLPGKGCEIVRPVKEVPTGWNMLVRHPDGMLVEYVQHREPHPDDDVLARAASDS